MRVMWCDVIFKHIFEIIFIRKPKIILLAETVSVLSVNAHHTHVWTHTHLRTHTRAASLRFFFLRSLTLKQFSNYLSDPVKQQFGCVGVYKVHILTFSLSFLRFLRSSLTRKIGFLCISLTKLSTVNLNKHTQILYI